MRVVNVESVAHIAEKLQALDEHFAFLGGAVLPLLLSTLVSEPDFIQCLPGHLSPDSASQERVPILLHTIHQITQMQEGKP